MITLRRLKLENFLSHKNTEISFNDNMKLLIDGKSGSGKSAVIEAIIWCLYGKGRVDNRFLIRRGEAKAVVTLDLVAPDGLYRIIRTAKKTSHTLEVLFAEDAESRAEHIARSGIRDIQDFIENELLHASYLLFVNSIAYMQDNPDIFVKQTAAKRKELLLEIIQANRYSDLYKKASDRLTKEHGDEIIAETKLAGLKDFIEENRLLAGRVNELNMKLGVLEEMEDRYRRNIDEVRGRIDKEKDRVSKISILRSEIEKIDMEMRDHKRIVNSMKQTLDDTEECRKTLGRMELEQEALTDVPAKLAELEKKVDDEYDRKMKLSFLMSGRPVSIDYSKKLSDIDKQVKKLSVEVDKCPAGDKCPLGAPMREQIVFLEDEKKRLEKEAEDGERAIAEHMRKEAEVSTPILTKEEEELVPLYREQNARKVELDREVAQRRTMLERIDETPVKDAMANSQKALGQLGKVLKAKEAELEELLGPVDKPADENLLTELKDSLESVSVDIRQTTSELTLAEQAEEKTQKARRDIEDIEKALTSTRENIHSLTLTKEAFSQRGLPAVVVDYMIPRLEENINSILSQLSDFRIRIDTQRKNMAGDGMLEGLFLTIYNEAGEEFDFDSYSGGQKLKITVAISEALASLQKVGFRIMDETFTALDEESTDEFADIMSRLQAKFKQVVCITHLRNVKELFENSITITRSNGLSIINT